MTGFGAARIVRRGLVVDAEARSVNHRFVAVNARIPAESGLTDAEIEDRVRRSVHRGSVTLSVSVRREARPPSGPILDEAQARAAAAALRKLARDLGLAGDITLDLVARAPGVFVARTNHEAPDPGVRAAALQAVERALTALAAARAREGRALVAELRSRVKEMRRAAAAIEARLPRAVAESFARMRARVGELLRDHRGGVSDESLTREIAVLAERTDVAEELTRLRTHLDELDDLLSKDEPVGRRVEFLVQELLREVNTTGSKSGDLEITRLVLDLKATIERVREQAANLE